MKRNQIIVLLLAFISSSTFFYACKHEPATGIDLELLEMATDSIGYTWYKNDDALLARSSESGHGQPYLKTRFNTIAATQLDGNGKVISGITFPEGSVIVKELYDDVNTISRYAVLYKQSSNANADADGWVWGYVNPDGTVAEPAANKGSGCRGCHSQNGHIDYTLMNIAFP